MVFDDYLNGGGAAPMIAPPASGGTSPGTSVGAGTQSNGRMMRGASSGTASMLVWLIILILLVLSHTFTFSLQH